MPDFNYRAKTTSGALAEGVIQAASQQEAIRQLTRQSLFPIDVTDQHRKAWKLDMSWRRVGSETIADLLTQLSDLLINGVALLDSLTILAEQSPDARIREVLVEIRDNVSEGIGLDEAMSKHPKVFTNLTVSMVKAGLEGGFLEESLERVSNFLRKEAALKNKVISAMSYPMILAGIGFCFMIALVVFIVPMFEAYFDKLVKSGVGLPWITQALIFVSDALVRYGLLVLLVFIGLVVGIRKLLETEVGTRFLDHYKLKIPIAGRIFHESAVSRFCRVLGTLLRNGVQILKSLKIAGHSVGNVMLQDAIERSAENISSGNRLSEPLRDSGLVSTQVIAMIRVAEESNTLDDVLVKISDRMDQKIEQRLDSMVRLIEPIMLLTIGAIVMSIIIGVLLPIFDLTSTVD